MEVVALDYRRRERERERERERQFFKDIFGSCKKKERKSNWKKNTKRKLIKDDRQW